MFAVILSYEVPLEEVDARLEAHRAYLNKYFENETFLLAGRRVPRTGGVIIVRDIERKRLDHILAEDPFAREGIATYTVFEFEATKYAPALKELFGNT